MPRKPKSVAEPIYNVDKTAFLQKYMEIRFIAFNEFIKEFQNAPLVRFYYYDNNHHVHSVIICFMKHFAFNIYQYENVTAYDISLPIRPLYAKLNAGDSTKFSFWGKLTPAVIPPRSFEPQDFLNEIFDENQGASLDSMENYINSVYYKRNTNKWIGLSAISTGWGFSPENPVGNWANEYIGYDELCGNPDESQIGATLYNRTPEDLYKFWLKIKEQFEGFNMFGELEQLIMPVMENTSPIGMSALHEFQLIDKRDQRFLEYDVEGQIIGYKKLLPLAGSKSSPTFNFSWGSGMQDIDPKNIVSHEVTSWEMAPDYRIYMYYDISLVNINKITYVVSVDPTFIGNVLQGSQVTIMSTFENWIKFKKLLPIGVKGSPEWFPGNFPKTEYCHMAFYGGHSFYVPDGYTINPNMTRLTKAAGYLSVYFVGDLLATTLYHIPMRNTVAYGKWPEYPLPNTDTLKKILQDQWWNIFSKYEDIREITSKEALVQMGKSGTMMAGIIPGMNSLLPILGGAVK